MNTALPVSAYQEVSTDEPSNASADDIWEPLDLLAEESAGLAKWRGFAVDGNVVPSYVFIGLRGESVPIRLALLAVSNPKIWSVPAQSLSFWLNWTCPRF